MVVTASGEVAKSSGKKWLRFNMMDGYLRSQIGRRQRWDHKFISTSMVALMIGGVVGSYCSICSLNIYR